MAPIVATLLSHGMSLLANAALAKGKEYIQEKTGVDLGKAVFSDQDLTSLKKFEMEHEEELMKLRLEDNRLEAELEKAHMASQDSARDAYQAEWQYASHDKPFDRFVDGTNRLVRPTVTFGLLGMLFGIVPVPGGLPTEYWTVLMICLGFWFGGRLLTKDKGVDALKALRGKA